MAKGLKPCPFCGGEAEIERYGDDRRSTTYACTNCGCHLETGEKWGNVGRWNNRTLPEQPTLRDQFAMAALTLVPPRGCGAEWSPSISETSAFAYAMADAMMEARKR